MIITSKSDYGLRAALHLAKAGRRARLREISVSQYIPEAVCAQVMRRLVSARLVDSQAGPHGGYTLARSADEISVASILTAADRDICIFRCVEGGCDCELSGRCAFQVVLQSFGRDLATRLESMTLAELRDAQAKFPENEFDVRGSVFGVGSDPARLSSPNSEHQTPNAELLQGKAS